MSADARTVAASDLGGELSPRGSSAAFVLAEPFRRIILRIASTRPHRARVGVSTIVLVEEFVRRGDYAQAARVAVRGRSWRLASRCVRIALARGEMSFFGDLAELFADVPVSDLARDPYLAALAGTVASGGGRGPEPTELLLAALNGLEHEEETDVLLSQDMPSAFETRVWKAMIAMVCRQLLGDIGGALAAAADASETLSTGRSEEIAPARALFALALSQVELVLAFAGRTNDVDRRAFELHASALRGEDRSLAEGAMALAAVLRGQWSRAHRCVQKAEAAVPGDSVKGFARLNLLMASAWLALARGDHGELADLLERRLPLQDVPLSLRDMHHYLQARHAHLVGAPARVWVMLEAIGQKSSPLWVAGESRGLRIEMLAAERRFARAEDEASGESEAPAVRLAMAKTLFQTARIEEAQRVAARLYSSDAVSHRHRMRAAVIVAACRQALGDEEGASDCLRDVEWLRDGYPVVEVYDDAPESLFELMARSAEPPWAASRPRLGKPRRVVGITPSEQVVLQVLLEEPRTSVIAQRLHLSTNTVKSHLRSVYRKLNVHSREDALTAATERGLF